MSNRFFIAILYVFCFHTAVPAQRTIDQWLHRVSDTYRETAYLGFHLRYTYANDGKPDQPVDTLSGDVYMDKGRSRFVLGNTVSLLSGIYALEVLPEQKLLYVARASQNNQANPLNMMDSLLHRMDDITTEVGIEGSLAMITFHMPPGRAYTQIRMSIDTLSGYLFEVTYYLHTAGFVDRSELNRPDHQAPYEASGRVTIAFSQYQTGRFGEEAFDTGRYFTRSGDRFETSAAYRDYRIFLASTHY